MVTVLRLDANAVLAAATPAVHADLLEMIAASSPA
jgi:hypothetical protein